MDLMLKDAARLLGKNVRQVRYLVTHGKIPAQKIDGRWLIKREDLPLSRGQRKARQTKLDQSSEKAHAVLSSTDRPNRKIYSVRKLNAFNQGRVLLAELRAQAGPDHAGTTLLGEGLTLLTCACHEYQAGRKAGYFQAARERMCRAVAALMLADPPHDELAGRLEAEVLPSLGGLIRQVERRQS